MTAQPKRITGARDVSVQDIAERMLTEANGDMIAAAKKMKGYISNFPRMLDEVIDTGISTHLSRVGGIQRAALDRIGGRSSENSTPFAKAPFKMNAAAKAAASRIAGIGKTAGEALLNYPYTINGIMKPLREFTGIEVRQHGESMKMTAGTTMRNAHYLISVGQAAGDKKVGTLPVSEIEAMRKRADQLDV